MRTFTLGERGVVPQILTVTLLSCKIEPENLGRRAKGDTRPPAPLSATLRVLYALMVKRLPPHRRSPEPTRGPRPSFTRLRLPERFFSSIKRVLSSNPRCPRISPAAQFRTRAIHDVEVS